MRQRDGKQELPKRPDMVSKSGSHGGCTLSPLSGRMVGFGDAQRLDGSGHVVNEVFPGGGSTMHIQFLGKS